MAQYRLSAAVISRSEGKSVIAATAYRAAAKLLDERTGDIKDYLRRHRSVLYTLILTPENAPEWMHDRQRLWNDVEHREDKSTKRSTAQLARDIELSLPYELTHEQRVELVCDFVKKEFVDRGMVADIAIHAPPRRGDNRNHHAHVLLTMRHIKGDGFGLKNRTWNDDELLEHWRERWEVYENRALAKYGHPEARVDHRSLKDQGIDREPTKHLGPGAQQMEDQGIHSDRGDENRRIKEANDNLALLKKEVAESDQRLAELMRQLETERMERIEKIVRKAKAFWEKAERLQADPQERAKEPPGSRPRRRPSRERQLKPERIEQIQRTVRAAKAFWEGAGQLQAAALRLQKQDSPPYHPGDSAGPVPGGGKAAPMPDDLSENQKIDAADPQQQAWEAERARQDQAIADELKRQETARKEQDKLQDEIIATDNRLKELGQIYRDAQEHRERLVQQTRELEEASIRHEREENTRKSEFQRQENPAEHYVKEHDDAVEGRRQGRIYEQERTYVEGDIRNPYSRYADALHHNYEYDGDPYKGLARAAIAEHTSFRYDQDLLHTEIANTADPKLREALEIRRKIEGYEYLMITGERIAVQSEIITGRTNSDEAVRMRGLVNGKDILDEDGNKIGFEDGYKQKAQALRQEYRELQAERMEEKQQVRPEPAKAPEREGSEQPGTLPTNKLDAVIQRVDDAAKAQERKTQQDKERERNQERGRER